MHRPKQPPSSDNLPAYLQMCKTSGQVEKHQLLPQHQPGEGCGDPAAVAEFNHRQPNSQCACHNPASCYSQAFSICSSPLGGVTEPGHSGEDCNRDHGEAAAATTTTTTTTTAAAAAAAEEENDQDLLSLQSAEVPLWLFSSLFLFH